MSSVTTFLDDRSAELREHVELIGELEQRSLGGTRSDQALRFQQKQLLILRSGLMVHIYNVVEAVMTRALEELEIEIAKHEPRAYGDKLFKEWIKSSAQPYDGVGPEKLLQRIEAIGLHLIGRNDGCPLTIRRSSGNWDDRSIARVSSDLGIRLKLDADLRKLACGHYVDDISRLGFVRKRRNELAHGVLTFEEGTRDRTFDDLRELVDVISKYLGVVVDCFQTFVVSCQYLAHKQQ